MTRWELALDESGDFDANESVCVAGLLVGRDAVGLRGLPALPVLRPPWKASLLHHSAIATWLLRRGSGRETWNALVARLPLRAEALERAAVNYQRAGTRAAREALLTAADALRSDAGAADDAFASSMNNHVVEARTELVRWMEAATRGDRPVVIPLVVGESTAAEDVRSAELEPESDRYLILLRHAIWRAVEILLELGGNHEVVVLPQARHVRPRRVMRVTDSPAPLVALDVRALVDTLPGMGPHGVRRGDAAVVVTAGQPVQFSTTDRIEHLMVDVLANRSRRPLASRRNLADVEKQMENRTGVAARVAIGRPWVGSAGVPGWVRMALLEDDELASIPAGGRPWAWEQAREWRRS